MRHMLEENMALCIGRQFSVIGTKKYDIVFKTPNIVDFNLFRRGGELVFPLYLYPETDKKDLFSEHETGEKKPNIKPELFEELKKNFNKEVTPEEIFYYIYAVLYSNTYRKKYAEFLKIDFPRIPFTKDYKLFIQLGKLAKKLADLHLLKP
jgi:predicted helicase